MRTRGALGMRATWCLFLLLGPELAGAKSLVASAVGALKPLGDSPVVTLASCGAGRRAGGSAMVGQALGTSPDEPAALVDDIALLNVEGASAADGAAALAACDALVLEVRFADLVESTPHGLSQLQPQLLRSLRVARDVGRTSPPRLLLLVVTEHDAGEASEEEVSAFAKAQLDEVMSALTVHDDADGGEAAGPLSMQLRCFFVPNGASADAREKALSKLRDGATSLTSV